MAKISEYPKVDFIFPDDLFLKSSEGDTQTVSAAAISDVMGGGKCVILITDTSEELGNIVITVTHESGYADAVYTGTLVDHKVEIPVKWVGNYTITFTDDEGTEYSKAINIPQLGVIASLPIAKFKGTVYGFYQNFSDKAPATTISYNVEYDGEPVANAEFTPMHTNTTTGTDTPGDWQDFLTNFLKNLPFMVTPDGKADYQLNPDDYTKKMDGTASDYNNTSYVGGAFAWLNRVYVKEVYDANGRTVYFSDTDWDDPDFYPLGFVDGDDNILEGVWLPMGYMDASGRTLVAGTTPVASKTCPQEKAIIDGFSSRGRFLGGPILNLLRDLEYMLYKSTDIQKEGGYGRCNAGSQAVVANQVVSNGQVKGFYGAGNKTTMNKAFHSQVLFSYQQWLRDPYTLLVSGVLKLSPNYEYDITGNTYDTAPNNGNWNGANTSWNYPSKLVNLGKELGSFPYFENTASTSTGLCDGVVGSTSGVRVALRLGSCHNDLTDGPAAVHLDYEASLAYWGDGVALLLLPEEGYAPQAA